MLSKDLFRRPDSKTWFLMVFVSLSCICKYAQMYTTKDAWDATAPAILQHKTRHLSSSAQNSVVSFNLGISLRWPIQLATARHANTLLSSSDCLSRDANLRLIDRLALQCAMTRPPNEAKNYCQSCFPS